MIGRVFSNTESCDEELAYDELVASYKGLYARSAEICKLLGEQKKINSQLLTERSRHLTKISELKNEVTFLNSQLEQVKKQVEMMTNDSTILDEVTEDQGKRKANGIKFEYKPLNQKQSNMNFGYALEDHGMIRKEKHDKNVKVIGPLGLYVAPTNKIMLKHSQGHQNGKKTTRPWICHHCKRKGHIRHFCYKLYCYPKQSEHKSSEPEARNVKKEWMSKSNNVGPMVHTSQKSSSNDIWYFDSGCSRQMTRKSNYFENIRSFKLVIALYNLLLWINIYLPIIRSKKLNLFFGVYYMWKLPFFLDLKV